MTEVWFRNPHNYIRELVEAGGVNVAWDYGMLQKRRIDPWRHAEAYFAGRRDWRLLIIGTQGSPMYDADSAKTPVAVYPTWDATNEQLELLEEMMANPLGDDADACNDPTVPDEQRPVAGQEHMVIVTDLPNLLHGTGRMLIRKLKELQEDYPDCKLYIHGTYSWRVCFGLGFGAADVDPRTNASKGKVTLPSGKEMIAERTMQVPQWVTILGMKPIELTREPRNRCIYNVKSALWAGEHFMENIAFKSAGTAKVVDTTSPTTQTKPQTLTTSLTVAGPQKPYQPGDKINCDTCSVQNTCKYYRQGSVCSVPGSEPAELARQFKTRDADQIIDGLGTLMALGARRLDQGVASEQMYGELDPEVTKMISQLFSQGEKLAKLIDPNLRQGHSVQVNVGAGGANPGALTAATPNQLIGGIVRELEARGVPRENITPKMIENLVAEMAGADNASRAIQGEVLAKRDE